MTGWARSRPSSHWIDYPDVTYGVVGSAEFNNWDTKIDRLAALGYDPRDYGAAWDNVTDDTAAMQATVNAAVVTGGRVLLPYGNAYIASSVTLPPNMTKRVTFAGLGTDATTIRIGAASKGFLCYAGRTVDGDIYRNATVQDFTVDAAAVTANTQTGGGIISTLLTGVGSSDQLNTSLADIIVRRVKGINGPINNDGSHQFFWVCLASSVDTGGPQQTMNRIYVDDWELYGGDTGVYVGAFRRSSAVTDYANVICDDIYVRRWRHIPQLTAPTSYASNHVIVGARAIGKKARVSDGYGYGCGDVGIETNAWDDAIVERCTVEDSWNACFYHTNLAPPNIATRETIKYVDCTAKRTSYSPSSFSQGVGQGYGWYFNQQLSGVSTPNKVRLRGCTFVRNTADAGVLGSALYADGVASLRLDDWLCDEQGLSYSTSGQSFFSVYIHPRAGNTTVFKVRGARFQIAGAATGNGGLWSAMKLVQGIVEFDWDDVTINYGITGISATACRALYLGDDSLSTTLKGVARNCRIESSTDTSAWLFTVGASNTTTIQHRILIDNPDVRAISESNAATETKTTVFYRNGGGSFQNYANVFVRGGTPGAAKYPAVPAAVTPSGSPYTYQNQDGFSQRLFVQGGTVSKIEWSQDGSTFYDLGVVAGAIMLEGGDYLRITYTVAPTVTKQQLKS